MFGNAYIQKIRNNSGIVIELYPLNPNSVDVYVRDDGMPYLKMNYVAPDGTASYKQFTYDEVIHIKGFSRNGIYGLSVIDTFRRLFDGYNELEEAGTSIAKNAAKPNGVVYYPNNIKEEELEKMKSGWKSGFSQSNSGKTAFLPNNIKVEAAALGMTAQDAEFIQQKQFSAQRIAADIFRVPLHMLGLQSNPTYASVEQQAIEFVTYTLTPIITNIEQQIQKQLLDDSEDVYINFNVAGLLRGDIKTRIEWYRFALEHGVMTANDVNEAEDTGIFISPQKGGDDYVRPLNFGVVGENEGTGSISIT
jgi:HK97 family phage portal protein